jgi:hypothetical protein
VLEPLQTDPRQRGLDRSDEGRAELEAHHAEVLERPPADPPTLRLGEGGKREGEVRERGPPAAYQQEGREVTQSAPQPGPETGRQPPEEGDDDGRDQTTRRRRSLKISTPIGITERMITMMTMMCM